MPQRTVLLVSDLPTWGRVALASAAPLVEAAGFQACCLPTALLSTHGAYPGYVLEPQTRFLEQAWNHLRSLNLGFAGAAIGFLADRAQFALVDSLAETVAAAGGLVLVDPILGDNGHRYGLFGDDHVPGFRALLARAHVTTPNLTEAALLLGEDPTRAVRPAEVAHWAKALSDLGPRFVAVTSAPIPGRGDRMGVAWYNRDTGRAGLIAHRRVGPGLPGTGDALAARLLTFLIRGWSFPSALARAVRGTVADVARSRASGRPALWGPEGPLRP